MRLAYPFARPASTCLAALAAVALAGCGNPYVPLPGDKDMSALPDGGGGGKPDLAMQGKPDLAVQPQPDLASGNKCPEPNPQGCVNGGACPPNSVCDPTVGCKPSSCTCDPKSGGWICTDDCGGGTCVPVGKACPQPNPAGCVMNGCPKGFKCDQTVGCKSSQCKCDMNTGTWLCTRDCGGGECVPDGMACPLPSPAGCKMNGCPRGFVCDFNAGCTPSSCVCDPNTGTWACTKDCGGGTCVQQGGGGCVGPNPEGCRNQGCPNGQKCDLNAGCKPSKCACDPQGGWICTADCGGGTCV